MALSLPAKLAKALREAALKRSDMNKSALASEVLAEHFGIALPIEGGDAEKHEVPA